METKRKQVYAAPSSLVVELKMGSVLCASGGDGSLAAPGGYQKQTGNPFTY